MLEEMDIKLLWGQRRRTDMSVEWQRVKFKNKICGNVNV